MGAGASRSGGASLCRFAREPRQTPVLCPPCVGAPEQNAKTKDELFNAVPELVKMPYRKGKLPKEVKERLECVRLAALVSSNTLLSLPCGPLRSPESA